MGEQVNSPRIVIVQYCDDIRREVGNKYSLMGCYDSEMIIEELPVVLPKLCARVIVLTPADRPLSSLVLRATFNDDLLGEMEMPVDKMHDAFKQASSRSDLGRVAFQAMMVFSPLSIAEPGRLQISAETEEGVIPGTYISIRERTQDDPPLQ